MSASNKSWHLQRSESEGSDSIWYRSSMDLIKYYELLSFSDMGLTDLILSDRMPVALLIKKTRPILPYESIQF